MRRNAVSPIILSVTLRISHTVIREEVIFSKKCSNSLSQFAIISSNMGSIRANCTMIPSDEEQ